MPCCLCGLWTLSSNGYSHRNMCMGKDDCCWISSYSQNHLSVLKKMYQCSLASCILYWISYFVNLHTFAQNKYNLVHLLDSPSPQKSYVQFNANFPLIFIFYKSDYMKSRCPKIYLCSWFRKFSVLFFLVTWKSRTDLTLSNYSCLICLPGPLPIVY